MIPEIVTSSYRKQPPKPIVVTEPWYEFIRDNPTADEIRFGAWSAMLSGAAGHTYGGGHVWKAHVPEAPAGNDSWPMEMNFDANTLDYPGVQSIGYLSQFFHQIEWWKLEPHPEVVMDNPSPYCAAILGQEYVIFLRWGGTVKVNLKDAESGSTLTDRWIDLVNQKTVKEGKTTGGSVVELQPPEDYPGVLHTKDWVIHLQKNR